MANKHAKACASGDTLLRSTLIPLSLMLVSPPAILFVWVVCYHHDGSIASAMRTPFADLRSEFPAPSVAGATTALAFLLSQLGLLLLVPGRHFRAVPTPMGNRPRYKLNGLRCFALTHAALLLLHYWGYLEYGGPS